MATTSKTMTLHEADIAFVRDVLEAHRETSRNQLVTFTLSSSKDAAPYARRAAESAQRCDRLVATFKRALS